MLLVFNIGPLHHLSGRDALHIEKFALFSHFQLYISFNMSVKRILQKQFNSIIKSIVDN